MIWSKADPTALGTSVPKDFTLKLPEVANTFKRYSNEMYLVASVPAAPALAEESVRSFFIGMWDRKVVNGRAESEAERP